MLFNDDFFANAFWSPWSQLSRWQDDMSRFAGTGGRTAVRDFPPLNVFTNAEGAFVTARVPGLAADSIDVSVEGDALTIKGERKAAETESDAHWVRHERGEGVFSRSVQLPFRIAGDKVNAVYRKGILEIMVPRAEEEQPRKIAVKAQS